MNSQMANSSPKRNIPQKGDGCMMANSYRRQDLRERTMIKMQLAQALGLGPSRFISTAPVPRLRANWLATAGGGRRSCPGRARNWWPEATTASMAEHRARRQSAIPRVPRKLTPSTALWELVAAHLRRGLSPAPIESTLARMPGPAQLSRETIYTALYAIHPTDEDLSAEAFTKIFNRFDSQMRRSMTYDQGAEMRHHKRLTANTGVDVYFAHPRPLGAGEQRKHQRLLRQYLPKGADLPRFSQQQLDDISWLLNTRPRKTLGGKAPAELFLPEGAFDLVQYWSTVPDFVALGI